MKHFVSHETRPRASARRARRYARLDYSRRWIAQYLAAISHTSIIHQERVLDLIQKKQGRQGVIAMFLTMHQDAPHDVIIYAALIAEAVALRREVKTIRLWSRETMQPYEDADVLRGARAA